MTQYGIFWVAQPDQVFNNLLSSQGADSAYRLSPFSRMRFVTDASSIDVNMVGDIQGTFPQYATISVFVNGSYYADILATSTGMRRYTQGLPAGSGKTIELVSGLQSRPGAAVLGTYIRNVVFSQNNNTSRLAVPTNSPILLYGDSLAVGGNATRPSTDAWFMKIASVYSGGAICEAFGYRALSDDCVDAASRTAFAAKLASVGPPIIWIAIGTNDYGLATQGAASFGTAYADLLDKLHALLPSTRIYCQTPLTRFVPASEATNAVGSSLPNYRTQIATAQSARSGYCILVDGPSILSSGDMDTDGIHPTTSGHANYYTYVKSVLGL